jgi:hypothetical protein
MPQQHSPTTYSPSGISLIPTNITQPANYTVPLNSTVLANSTASIIFQLLGNTTLPSTFTAPANSTPPLNFTDPANSMPVSNATMFANFTMSSLVPPADPYNQTITLIMANGEPFNITMIDVTVMNNENIQMGLMYGAQIGLSVLMLIVLVLLTQPAKRRSVIFMSNLITLVFDVIRSSLMATWLASAWNNPYSYFSGDVSHITKGLVAQSIVVVIFKVFETVAIEVSLITQVRVVLLASSRHVRLGLLVLVTAIALMSVGMAIALLVINVTRIATMAAPLPIQQKLAGGANVLLTIGIGVCMVIFVTKLGYALMNRRKLGLRKFGPMQIIFIMGVQTMVVPGKISLLPRPEQDKKLILPISDSRNRSPLRTNRPLLNHNHTHRRLTPTLELMGSNKSRKWASRGKSR